MAAPELSIALSPNPRNWPIIDGSVTVEGADLICNVLHPSLNAQPSAGEGPRVHEDSPQTSNVGIVV